MNVKRLGSVGAALFLLLLLLVGLFTCDDYGLPCDEPAEQVILQENMHEYAVRLWGSDSAPARWYASRGIDRISQSIEKDHGESAYYPFVPVLTALLHKPHMLTQAWKVYTWLWFIAGVCALYALCRHTGLGRTVSCMGVLILYLCPRFFAEGHYNNKDVVLLSLTLLTMWQGVRFLKKPSFARGLLFSLAGAAAFNTKVAGAFAWAVFGVCAIIWVSAGRRWNARMVAVAITTVSAFFVFFALLTPACWADPIAYLKYLLVNASGFTRWTGVVVFRGMVFDVTAHPLPRYYLIWMMMVTLPIYVIPLAAAGQIGVFVRVVRQKSRALRDPVSLSLTAVSLCWFVPMLCCVLIRPVLYNGWRHFYFVFAGVAVLGAHGIRTLYCLLRRYCSDGAMQLVFVAGLCLFFVWTARDIACNHPYQYGYYNRLGHENAEVDMELDYWDVSTVNAMERLLRTERDENLPLHLGARDDMSWFGVEHGYEVLAPQDREMLTVAYERDAPYLFSNTTYARIYGVAPPMGYHELFTINSYGLRLCTVYEKDGAV